MKKPVLHLVLSALACVLLWLGCGSARTVTVAPPPADYAQEPAPDPAPAPPATVEDAEANGPHLPPAVPPTRYAPRIRRAQTPAPPLPQARNDCHLAVEVRNYDGTDGCGILLETDDGVLLLVGVPPRGEPLEAGTRISIGYEYMKSYDGAKCANADAIIRITCKRLLRVSSGVDRPVVCEAYDTPAAWLLQLAKDYSATYVTRFPWREGRYVYLMESPFGQYLYDCRGYLICKPRKNCLGFIEDFSSGVLIYEG